jgi:hypothetical protein
MLGRQLTVNRLLPVESGRRRLRCIYSLRALRVRAAEPVLVPEGVGGGLRGARKAGIGYEANGCVGRDGGGGVWDVVVEEEERVDTAAERGCHGGQVTRLK